jgi:uncharacterized phage protein (TIGR01671 family)
MREIKFRGKRKDNKEWVYGDLTQSYPKDFPPEIKITWWVKGRKYYSTNPVDKETVGQYTGLKDKNGIEIYEGDIIAMPHVGGTAIGPVEWYGAEWVYRKPNGLWGFSNAYGVEVIGNIHENPELLEEINAK